MADFAKWGEAISRAIGYDGLAFIEAYANNRNQQNLVAVEENIIASIFVKYYRDYETKNNLSSTFVGSPEVLHKALVDFAQENEININSRQFPKAPNILVKKLKTIKSNLKDGYGIIVDTDRDSYSNSIITIYRNKAKANTFPQFTSGNYYEIRVQKHLQNYTYNLGHQTPYNNELTSVTSEPPITLQNSAGGTEATEVTSLPCGADAPEDDGIITVPTLSLDNDVNAGDPS
jgi:hypothetical protein